MAQAALGLRRDMMRHLTGCDAAVMTHGTVVQVYVDMVIGNTHKGGEIDKRMTG